MDKWLSRLVNVAILVVAAVVLHSYLSPYAPAKAPEPFKAGDTLDAQKLGLTKRSVLIVTRSSCVYCTQSMDLYRDLRPSESLGVIGVAMEPLADNVAYLEKHGVKVDHVVDGEVVRGKVRATPTLILVESNGTVIRSWTGMLSGADVEKTKSIIKQE